MLRPRPRPCPSAPPMGAAPAPAPAAGAGISARNCKRARALKSSTRPSRLHTTTLWLSSAISAASRLFSCSTSRLPSAMRWPISRFNASRCCTSAVTALASAWLPALAAGASAPVSNSVAVAKPSSGPALSNTCTRSANCPGTAANRRQAFSISAPPASEAKNHTMITSAALGSTVVHTASRWASGSVAASRPKAAASSNAKVMAGKAATASAARSRPLAADVIPAAPAPWPPAPASRRAWSYRRRRPGPGLAPHRYRGPWP